LFYHKKVEILFNNPGLRELNLGENKINHDGIIALTSVLNWNNDTLEVNLAILTFYNS
jgi:hypothetical protein